MRRNALLPLLPIEMEPGEAIKMITQQAHPFTIAPELPPALEEAVKFLRSLVAEIRSFRIARMEEFERAAHDCFPGTMKEIESIKDQPLKNFMLREVPKEQQPEVGVVNHLLLWDYVFKHSGSQDANFMTSMRRGFLLVGEIEPSHLWSPFFPPAHPFFELPLRAWALRQRVIEKVRRSSKAVNFQDHGKEL